MFLYSVRSLNTKLGYLAWSCDNEGILFIFKLLAFRILKKVLSIGILSGKPSISSRNTFKND